MLNNDFPVGVLGTGELAAAVRVQLRKQSLAQWSEEASDCFQNQPALFLACSDFENASLCAALGQRVLRDRSSVLFACITGSVLRVGPLVSEAPFQNCREPYLTRSWDFSLSDNRQVFVPPGGDGLVPNADTRRTQVALIGARRVIGELAKVLFAAEGTRLIERVAEIDSPLIEGECASAYETSGRPSDETFVASHGRRRSVWSSLAGVRHPAVID